jgi:hypothetical protein
MTQELQKGISDSMIEQALVGGDLSKLSVDQRVSLYHKICDSLQLNPLTKPFAYITLNGKLTLYALKDCTEQLRKIHEVSVTGLDAKSVDDLYVVVATGRDKTGRTDASTGAVPFKNLIGEAKSNAIMKAETKAKRRLTLSICGLGMLDESEVSGIKDEKFKDEKFTDDTLKVPVNTPSTTNPEPVKTITPEVVTPKPAPPAVAPKPTPPHVAGKALTAQELENIRIKCMKAQGLPSEIKRAFSERGWKQKQAADWCETKGWDVAAIRHELALDVEEMPPISQDADEIPFGGK